MTINSRRKGASAERELSNLFKELGFTARRRQQYNGTDGSDDVCVEELEGEYFIECKAVQSINMHTVMDKAIEQCGSKKPLIFHKRNRKGWLVVMRPEDFFTLLMKGRQ